jgi:uncharacterized protein (TIGR02246 family)
MRIARWVFLLMLAVLIGACAGQPKTAAVDTAAVTASLDSLNTAFVAAVAARDTNAVVSFYAPDAQLLPPAAPRADGHDAIRAAWVGFLQTPGLELQLTSVRPIVAEAGDIVIDVVSYAMKFTDAKCKPMEDVGKYVTVVKKVGGEWKLVVDMFNSDKPATGM